VSVSRSQFSLLNIPAFHIDDATNRTEKQFSSRYGFEAVIKS
jgi:hypothetical protein